MNLLVFELLCAVTSFVKKSMFSTSMLLRRSLVNTSSRDRSSSKFSCVVPSHSVGAPNVPRMCRGSESVNPVRLFYQQVVARQDGKIENLQIGKQAGSFRHKDIFQVLFISQVQRCFIFITFSHISRFPSFFSSPHPPPQPSETATP